MNYKYDPDTGEALYDETTGEPIPLESPSEMRARAKAEFASDWLSQKKAEAESIRETPMGKVASALFPRSVENVVQEKQKGFQDSDLEFLAADALKDVTSLPGRLLWSGYDKEVQSTKPFDRITESMSNLNGEFGKRIVTDPLLPLFAGIGAAPIAMGYKMAAGATLPFAETTVEKGKYGENPTALDAGISLVQGILPEAVGPGVRYIGKKMVNLPMTDKATIEMLTKKLSGEADEALSPREIIEATADINAAKNRISQGFFETTTKPLPLGALIDMATGATGLGTLGAGGIGAARYGAKIAGNNQRIRDAINEAGRLLLQPSRATSIPKAVIASTIGQTLRTPERMDTQSFSDNDARLYNRQMEILRFDPNDASAKRIAQEIALKYRK